jgi:integrase
MLAMRGVPKSVIARQLGHADTRMTERHYAHLVPNYVADAVRSALSSIGIVELPKVIAFHAADG